MEGTFGPFYASPLQESVTHAERLVVELSRLEADVFGSRWFDPQNLTDEEVWILGRASEVETVVTDIAREWRAGLLSAVGAATVLDRYLDAVHAGLCAAFAFSQAPCCAEPVSTIIAADESTRIAPFLEVLAMSLRTEQVPRSSR
jgi:hypothetical protein